MRTVHSSGEARLLLLRFNECNFKVNAIYKYIIIDKYECILKINVIYKYIIIDNCRHFFQMRAFCRKQNEILSTLNNCVSNSRRYLLINLMILVMVDKMLEKRNFLGGFF